MANSFIFFILHLFRSIPDPTPFRMYNRYIIFVGLSKMRPRAVLDPQQVLNIFRLRPSANAAASTAAAVGVRFGVNEKTVRDIWVGRTWRHATIQLLTRDEALPAQYHPPKSLGRPKGSKDRTPRKRSDCNRLSTHFLKRSEAQPLHHAATFDNPAPATHSLKDQFESTMPELLESQKSDSVFDDRQCLHSVASTSVGFDTCPIDTVLYKWNMQPSILKSSSVASIDPFANDWMKGLRECRSRN